MINIVLFEPQIPQNTANIIRTCVATKSAIHIIKPIGFDLDLDHPILKRSSVNYIDKIIIHEYDNFTDFMNKNNYPEVFVLSRFGTESYLTINYDNSDLFIMFGSESSGVSTEVKEHQQTNLFRIPMHAEMRSLNLANCVAIVTYSLLAQTNFDGLNLVEP